MGTFESGVRMMVGLIRGKSIESFYANAADPLHAAFAAKVAVMPGPWGMPMVWSLAKRRWEKIRREPRSRRTVAYVQVPFCETRCLYCMFYQNPWKEEAGRRYTEALLKELSRASRDDPLDGPPVEALYFGGGTPTALSAADIGRMVRAARDCLPLADGCEITLEGRILNFTDEKVEAALDAGVNRFSIGVQTFDTRVRRSVQRADDRETVIRRLETIAGAGRAPVIVDLLYGFPGQDMAMWEDDIRTAAELPLEGIDCYQLNYFERAPITKYVAGGRLPEPPSPAERADMYARAVEVMRGYPGWRKISCTHWARGGRERSVYNSLAKGSGDCLAFGCGAGGKHLGHSFMEERKLENWLSAVGKDEKPIFVMLTPGKNWHLLRDISSAVERGPLNIGEIGRPYGVDTAAAARPLLDQWVEAGLYERDGEVLVPTVAGEFWSSSMAQLLVDYLAKENSNWVFNIPGEKERKH